MIILYLFVQIIQLYTERIHMFLESIVVLKNDSKLEKKST